MTPAITAAPAAVFPEATAQIDKLDLSEFENRVNQLREMMLIGLAAYGEIERLDNKVKLYQTCKIAVPSDLRVIHPTGTAETVGEFADALRSLDSMHFEVIRIATEACRKNAPKPEPLRAVDNGNPSKLEQFGHEICQRTGAIHSTILAGLELMRKHDNDQNHNEVFRSGQVFETAAKLLHELSADAADAELNLVKWLKKA